MRSKKRWFLALCLLGVINTVSAAAMLEDVLGAPISVASLKGKWVFINDWASWCDPCVDEISELNRFYARHRDTVRVFAVNHDKISLQQQQQVMQQFGVRYPGLNPASLRVLHLKPLSVVPVTYVLNPRTELHTILYGGQRQKDFEEAMLTPPQTEGVRAPR